MNRFGRALAVGLLVFATVGLAGGCSESRDNSLPTPDSSLVPDNSLPSFVTTWGWVHVILGIVVRLAGVCLFTGAVWARTIGVLISVFVIGALTVYGRDITKATI